MSNTWLNDENVELLDIITEEYTPAQKKQLGIPPNAKARGGSWYIGNEYAGKVVKGKFVPAKKQIPLKKSKKSSTSTKKKRKTPQQIKTTVARVKSAKKALYKATYGSDDEAGYQMTRGASAAVSIKRFSQITGLSIEEVNELVSLYYPVYSKNRDTYGDPVLEKERGQIIIHPEFWKYQPPKPPRPPKKIKGVDVREPIDFEGYPTGKVTPKVTKSLGIEKKPLTREDKKQAKQHDSIVYDDPKLDDAVTDWREGSVWKFPAPRRNRLFEEVDSGIDRYDLKVQTNKPLYRGMHFEGKNSKFAKTILNKFRKGAVVKLPPAGFSLDASVAMSFASIGAPVVSVVLELQPKKQGIRGMHVWGGHSYQDEREVIARSGKYKVLNVILQEFQNAGYKGNQKALHLTVQIDQVTTVNESIDEGDSTTESETIIDFLMGDLMRHTAKNLQQLSA